MNVVANQSTAFEGDRGAASSYRPVPSPAPKLLQTISGAGISFMSLCSNESGSQALLLMIPWHLIFEAV